MEDVEKLKTAKDMIDYFNPVSGRNTYGYLFRAQFEPDDVGYKLIPTIFRKPFNPMLSYIISRVEGLMKSSSKEGISHYGSLKIQSEHNIESLSLAGAEKIILKDFVSRANKLGLQVPEAEKILNWEYSDIELLTDPDHQEARFFGLSPNISYLNLSERFSETHFSRPPLFMGLAQHHGCPTRLLDFSYNPYKALFHAINRKSHVDDAGFISLYFIPEASFGRRTILNKTSLLRPEETTSVYRLIKMPSSHNHYLFQQEGLFAYPVSPFHHLMVKGEYPSINSFAEMMAGRWPQSNSLKKVSIPASQTKELITHLKAFNISLSSMMPSFDNIVREMRENL